MSNVFSCRLPVYLDRDEAYELLPQTGVQAIELSPPGDGDYERCRCLAEKNGMQIATVATGVQLRNADSVAAFETVMERTAGIGTRKLFVSVQGKEGEADEGLIANLRQLCDKAAELDLTLCMETHPPYGTNGEVALATIREVDRPALGYNFDTANIYYYNEGTDSVTELAKALEHVASVHLKDTDGLPKSLNFPVLGQGVVDFPEVFRLLGERGFTGPYTLELEGDLMTGKDLAARHQIVVACMDYLRSIGAA